MNSSTKLSDVLSHLISEMETAKKFGWSPIPLHGGLSANYFIVDNNKVIQYKLRKSSLHEYEAARTIITLSVNGDAVMYRLEDNVSDDVLLAFSNQCKAARKFIASVHEKREVMSKHALEVLEALDEG